MTLLVSNGEVSQAATEGAKHDFGCKRDIHYPKGRGLWATPLSKMNSKRHGCFL